MKQTTSYMVPELVIDVHGEYETGRLAAALARMSVAGDLVRLIGELGAGKSTFCRHYLQALGHKGEVPSPTYTLVQTYDKTRFPVAHVDCYRMKEAAEMDGLGLEAYRQYGIILCEWPEKGGELVAEGQADFLDYHINSVENPGTLTVMLEGKGTEYDRKIVLRGSPAWQRRFALLPKLGIEVGAAVVTRPVTDERRTVFLDGLGLKDYKVEGLGGDWSGRSYWRVRLADGTTRMLMDAPPPQEGVAEYMQVAEYYAGIGLRTAKDFGADEAEGYLLTEDLGSVRLLDKVEAGVDCTAWYETAADALVTMCKAAPPAWGRAYSATDWWVEAVRFTNWYMPFARGKATSPEEYARWQELWTPLYERVMKLPKGLLPWDYQATNMMLLQPQEPALENFGLIDIQDARMAPICQDLSILLRDIRRNQDDALEIAILDRVAIGLGIAREELKLAVEVCNLHHCCRILGGLTRILVREGKKAGPIAFMARTWEVAQQSYACPELREIVDFMKDFEAPGLARLWKEASGKAA